MPNSPWSRDNVGWYMHRDHPMIRVLQPDSSAMWEVVRFYKPFEHKPKETLSRWRTLADAKAAVERRVVSRATA
jgi:hypothetical protein